MSMLFYEKVYEKIYESAAFYGKLLGPMRGRDDTFIRIATTPSTTSISTSSLPTSGWETSEAPITPPTLCLVPGHVHAEMGERWHAPHAA